jgi:T5orf172 domain
MEKQYVYILSISDKPDLIKVGKTSKNPHIRANDLSKNTAATGKFSVEWFIEVPDAELAEKIAHFKLKEYHFNKEYFSVKPYDAHLILEKFLIPLFEIKKPVIVYCGSIELTKKIRKRQAISKKLFEKSMIEKPERDEKIKVETETERKERLFKLKRSSDEYANKDDTNEKEKLFQERKKKILELAKKANEL